MTTYNTNLAAEFYVLSMLHRLGVFAAVTLGNKKAIDITLLHLPAWNFDVEIGANN